MRQYLEILYPQYNSCTKSPAEVEYGAPCIVTPAS